MESALVKYYEKQAGHGISGYEGHRYTLQRQKGRGLWGKFMSNWLYPALKYLGKQALDTGINVASDVLENGDNIKSSIKKRGKQAIENIGADTLKKARKIQSGSGRKGKKKSTKNTNNKKKATPKKQNKKQPNKKTANKKKINKKNSKPRGRPKKEEPQLPIW